MSERDPEVVAAARAVVDRRMTWPSAHWPAVSNDVLDALALAFVDAGWRPPGHDGPTGVLWACPRCAKTATVVGELGHVRCTCGHVSPSAHPVKPSTGAVIPSRRSDPDTSRKAEPTPVKAGTQRAHLLAAFGLEAAADGLTDEEAADLTAGAVPYRSEFAKRCSELRAAGLITETGATRPGVAGHQRIVSRITDAGRATLATL